MKTLAVADDAVGPVESGAGPIPRLGYIVTGRVVADREQLTACEKTFAKRFVVWRHLAGDKALKVLASTSDRQ